MMRLDAWLTLPDGDCRRVGEIAFSDTDQQGRYASAFRYTAEWLNDAGAFPLDPANLPLTAREFQARQLGAPLMALVREGDAHWLAKFASRRDEVDEVGLEAASLATTI